MQNIVIIGSSHHAKVIIDLVKQEGRYHVLGLLDRFRKVGQETQGCEILGGECDLHRLRQTHDIEGVFIAIGDNAVRETLANDIKTHSPDLPFISLVHPHASVANGVEIGEGSAILAGAVVSVNCKIGRFCILNSKSSLDHDSVLADFASLAPGVTTGGNCEIGTCSAIGIGAVLLHGISIGDHSVIGAGSLVNKPVPAYRVVYGSPAREIRNRNAGDPYL